MVRKPYGVFRNLDSQISLTRRRGLAHLRVSSGRTGPNGDRMGVETRGCHRLPCSSAQLGRGRLRHLPSPPPTVSGEKGA